MGGFPSRYVSNAGPIADATNAWAKGSREQGAGSTRRLEIGASYLADGHATVEQTYAGIPASLYA